MPNTPCWDVVSQVCGFQVFSGDSRQRSVNVSRCTLPTHTPFVPFTEVCGETVRKGSEVACGASFMAPRATKQSFFDPFHRLLRLQFGTNSGLFGQFLERL